MKQSPSSSSKSSPKQPVSARKLAANRANAQRSTGPRTDAGKARSSLNALRHGILARAAFNVTIEGARRRREFEALVEGLAAEFQPQTESEHLMVQQLAGCYWRLAKVWRHEQEAAWRMWLSPGMPMEEYNQYAMDYRAIPIRDQIIEKSRTFLPQAGLGDPTIPNGPTASTILRYQNAISAMLFRCLRILEQRKKARVEAEEPPDGREDGGEPDATAEESAQATAAEPRAGNASKNHERTQNASAYAEVSPIAAAENLIVAPKASVKDEESGGKPNP